MQYLDSAWYQILQLAVRTGSVALGMTVMWHVMGRWAPDTGALRKSTWWKDSWVISICHLAGAVGKNWSFCCQKKSLFFFTLVTESSVPWINSGWTPALRAHPPPCCEQSHTDYTGNGLCQCLLHSPSPHPIYHLHSGHTPSADTTSPAGTTPKMQPWPAKPRLPVKRKWGFHPGLVLIKPCNFPSMANFHQLQSSVHPPSPVDTLSLSGSYLPVVHDSKL